MKRGVLLIPLVVMATMMLLRGQLFAQSPAAADRMATAGQLYEEGRYTDAAAVYEQLVDEGRRDGTLYYNLGNAYYKSDDLGRAILNYLRAERISPRDADVAANLELARGRTTDLLEPESAASLAALLAGAGSWLTLNEAAATALALWFTLALLSAALVLEWPTRARRWLAYGAFGVVMLLGLLGLSLGSRLYIDSSDTDTVVVAETVDVKSGPAGRHVTEFTLHSGAEAHLLERRASWARVSLAGGQMQGWVPGDAVEEVKPAHGG